MRSKSPQLIGTDVDSLDDEKIEAYHAKSAHPSFRSRAVVFDCSNESVDITSRDCIDEERRNGIEIQECLLPPRAKEIALFVDAKTQSKVTTYSDYDGYSSIFLTKIYLDQLGFVNNFVRSMGLLRSIYIRNVECISGSGVYENEGPVKSA